MRPLKKIQEMHLHIHKNLLKKLDKRVTFAVGGLAKTLLLDADLTLMNDFNLKIK